MNNVLVRCVAVVFTITAFVACQTPFDEAREYFKESGDTLKIRAVNFLEQYVSYHYGVERYLVDCNEKRVDTINPLRFKNGPEYKNYLDSLGYHFKEGKPIYDEDCITADYIIENVNFAFDAWRKPWASKLCFTDFCTYILPYRNIDEALSSWRRSFYEKYIDDIIDSVEDINSSKQVAVYLLKRLRRELGYSQFMREFYIDYMTPAETEQMHFLECRALANYGTMVLRACGVPCATILTHWRFTELYHAAILLPNVGNIDKSYRTGIYDDEIQPMGQPKDTMASCITWQFNYELDSLSFALLSQGEVPKSLLLPVTRSNITDQFSTTLNFKVSVPDSLSNEPYLYLMRFNHWKWYPIRFAKVISNEAVFEKATIHQLYMYGKKDKITGDVVAFGVPFTIDRNGTVYEYRAKGDPVVMKIAYNCEPAETQATRSVGCSYWTEQGWKSVYVHAKLWGFNEKSGEYKLYTPNMKVLGFIPVFHLAEFEVPAWSVIYDDSKERPFGYKTPTEEDPDDNYMAY